MLLFKIQKDSVKAFMNTLFKENIFDNFETRGVEIVTFTKFQISSILSLSDGEERTKNYCLWGELRQYCFDIIKGKTRPKQIKIIFALDKEKTEELHNNTSCFSLNMLYDGEEITFTSATSQKTFDLDKSSDELWEGYLKKFFKASGIPVLYE